MKTNWSLYPRGLNITFQFFQFIYIFTVGSTFLAFRSSVISKKRHRFVASIIQIAPNHVFLAEIEDAQSAALQRRVDHVSRVDYFRLSFKNLDADEPLARAVAQHPAIRGEISPADFVLIFPKNFNLSGRVGAVPERVAQKRTGTGRRVDELDLETGWRHRAEGRRPPVSLLDLLPHDTVEARRRLEAENETDEIVVRVRVDVHCSAVINS